jgi:hypothetical protein
LIWFLVFFFLSLILVFLSLVHSLWVFRTE